MRKKEIPILFRRKEECCGCGACFSVCTQNAISMNEDDEGFEYPQLNDDACIGCFMCIKVCPLKPSFQSFE